MRAASFGMRAVVAACALFLLNCGGSKDEADTTPADPDPNPVASIEVTPTTTLIQVGQTATFTAVAKNAAGEVVSGKAFTWHTSDSAVATIGANGVASGLAAGTALVRAQTDGVLSNDASLTVQAAPVVGASSLGLIDAALKAGEISEETALIYRVYAVLSEASLPDKYRGVAEDLVESGVLDELNEKYAGLSEGAQATLRPFMLRPSDSESWLNIDKATASPVTRSIAEKANPASCTLSLNPYCRPTCGILSSDWKFVDATSSPFRVWYDSTTPNGLSRANFIVNEIDSRVWPTLIGTLGLRAPFNDSLVGLLCNGGNAYVDIYLVGGLGDRGYTQDESGTPYHSSTFILIKDSLGDEVMRHTVAHEIMHSIHWAYTTAAPQKSYGWFRDAIANWAVDQVYPPSPPYSPPRMITSLFQQASCQFRSPYVSLDDRSGGYCDPNPGLPRDYGSYLPLQFIGKTNTPQTVVRILERTQAVATAYDAIDDVTPGKFKEFWPKYARTLWNREPVKSEANSFKNWDDLDDKPILSQKVYASLQGGQRYAETELSDRVNNVSVQFYEFNFFDTSQYDPTGSDPSKPLPPTDDKTRSVLFHNTFYDNKKINNQKVSVRALYKPEGLPWQEEDWSDLEWIGFCRDAKAERLQTLVIIVASAETTDPNPKVIAAKKPKLMRNNIGCWGFWGFAKVTYRDKSWSSGGSRVVTATARYDAHAAGTYTNDKWRRVPITGPLFTSVNWNVDESYRATDGCRYEAHSGGSDGTIAQSGLSFGTILVNYFDQKSLPPDFQTDLPQAIGTRERAYFIQGGTNINITGSVTGCPPDQPGSPPPPNTTYTTPVGIWLISHIEPSDAPLVADDGHLRQTWIPTTPSDDYELKYEWDLEPIREP